MPGSPRSGREPADCGDPWPVMAAVLGSGIPLALLLDLADPFFGANTPPAAGGPLAVPVRPSDERVQTSKAGSVSMFPAASQVKEEVATPRAPPQVTGCGPGSTSP